MWHIRVVGHLHIKGDRISGLIIDQVCKDTNCPWACRTRNRNERVGWNDRVLYWSAKVWYRGQN